MGHVPGAPPALGAKIRRSKICCWHMEDWAATTAGMPVTFFSEPNPIEPFSDAGGNIVVGCQSSLVLRLRAQRLQF